MTNKYAEGYPGRRYYGGCQYVDQVEELAIQRAHANCFGCEHVNVQPHSGSHRQHGGVSFGAENPAIRFWAWTCRKAGI